MTPADRIEALEGPLGPKLLPEQAKALGYVNLYVRDDGTVYSMETPSGYRVVYGAPSYRSAALRAMEATDGQ